MQKYEYRLITAATIQEADKRVNKCAQEGFRVIACVTSGHTNALALCWTLEREMQPTAPRSE